ATQNRASPFWRKTSKTSRETASRGTTRSKRRSKCRRATIQGRTSAAGCGAAAIGRVSPALHQHVGASKRGGAETAALPKTRSHDMIRSLASVVLTALSVGAFDAVVLAQNGDLTGTYRCEGTSPSGNPYRTVVEIAKDDQTYVVKWYSRGAPAIGIGILRND